MFFNLLAEAGNTTSNIISYGMIILLVVIIVAVMFLNSRSAKKRQQETQNMLDAIQPGNKVKTIGGICGVVVEVDKEENTFVLETGSETSGKSYIKFDKQAVYQTDAVAKKDEPATVEAQAQAEEDFGFDKAEETEETTENTETTENKEE